MDALHKAVCAGQIDEVKKLVESGVDFNHVHGMQGTALCNAIASHQTHIAEYLVGAGCDVNAVDYDGEPPLLLALRKENVAVANILIDDELCNFNNVDPVTKQTALCFASSNGLVDIVVKLVESGHCDVVKSDADNNTAMHLAVLKQHRDVLKILSRIPDLKTLRNKGGLTPLHIAALNGDLETLELLYPSNTGAQHTLMEPLFGKVDFETSSRHPTKDLSIRTRYTNDTPLHYAVRESHRGMVEALIKRGVDINAQNNVAQTPLLIACGNSDLDIVLHLLENRAEPNTPGTLSNITDSVKILLMRDRQITPLGAAAYCDNLPLAETLVHHGADMNRKDDRGQTPLFVAFIQNSPDTAMFLLCTALEQAVDISSHNYCGDTLLHAVVRCTEKAYELACFLIGLGCPKDVRNRLGNLPIHEAIAHENEDVVRAIVDEGGDITELDRSGTSPMHLAALVGNIEIAKILLSHGADVNELSDCGKTPSIHGS
ncbi:serine/threonine-protein phosphatase 6 regulatory ankyrin repeat subunit C-like [Haliotis rubra]|uniref:serine/threonine-protein phosphatase 6 regulatory ankyrin repeat subunit C-like n=1 Tax=Haliotis rubra TaxID=36100 RepID=UPI001EE5CB1E|nr:serine/threonine-protein phosphatase 6 regulatory ankyrin repeat subunit C-like [Haliotis rubra]